MAVSDGWFGRLVTLPPKKEEERPDHQHFSRSESKVQILHIALGAVPDGACDPWRILAVAIYASHVRHLRCVEHRRLTLVSALMAL